MAVLTDSFTRSVVFCVALLAGPMFSAAQNSETEPVEDFKICDDDADAFCWVFSPGNGRYVFKVNDEWVYTHPHRPGDYEAVLSPLQELIDVDITEAPLVNGEKHGTETWRWGNGNVAENRFVNGKQHGTSVLRFADGTVIEYPYLNGILHGTKVRRYPDGSVRETPFAYGVEHGTEVQRLADGTIAYETHWAYGEEQP